MEPGVAPPSGAPGFCPLTLCPSRQPLSSPLIPSALTAHELRLFSCGVIWESRSPWANPGRAKSRRRVKRFCYLRCVASWLSDGFLWQNLW